MHSFDRSEQRFALTTRRPASVAAPWMPTRMRECARARAPHTRARARARLPAPAQAQCAHTQRAHALMHGRPRMPAARPRPGAIRIADAAFAAACPVCASFGPVAPCCASFGLGAPCCASFGLVAPCCASFGLIAPCCASFGLVAPCCASVGLIAPYCASFGLGAPHRAFILSCRAGHGRPGSCSALARRRNKAQQTQQLRLLRLTGAPPAPATARPPARLPPGRGVGRASGRCGALSESRHQRLGLTGHCHKAQ